MKEWVIVACRAEAKVFERSNSQESLEWLKTLTNKKGRRKEHEFNTDRPGFSYGKFSGATSPHALQGKHQHAEVVAQHFSKQIANFCEKSLSEKKFSKLTVFASAHLIGMIKAKMQKVCKSVEVHFIPKNIEKSDIKHIEAHLG